VNTVMDVSAKGFLTGCGAVYAPRRTHLRVISFETKMQIKIRLPSGAVHCSGGTEGLTTEPGVLTPWRGQEAVGQTRTVRPYATAAYKEVQTWGHVAGRNGVVPR
jgi:hypothetical protein